MANRTFKWTYTKLLYTKVMTALVRRKSLPLTLRLDTIQPNRWVRETLLGDFTAKDFHDAAEGATKKVQTRAAKGRAPNVTITYHPSISCFTVARRS